MNAVLGHGSSQRFVAAHMMSNKKHRTLTV
jgi:hypothetical protein